MSRNDQVSIHRYIPFLSFTLLILHPFLFPFVLPFSISQNYVYNKNNEIMCIRSSHFSRNRGKAGMAYTGKKR